jgi:asparagine synthase (glutamine-hydrolysing)
MLNDITTVSSMAAFSAETLFADWTREYGACDPQLTIVNSVDGLVRDEMMEKWHPLHTALYVWQKGHLSNIFLSCLGDRTEMAHSIEARTPFLDHHLTEYVNGLPPSVKIRWNAEEERFVEKWILREASRPFITDELYKRKKHVSDAYLVVLNTSVKLTMVAVFRPDDVSRERSSAEAARRLAHQRQSGTTWFHIVGEGQWSC